MTTFSLYVSTAGGDWLGRDGEDPMTAISPDRTDHVGLGMGPDDAEEA